MRASVLFAIPFLAAGAVAQESSFSNPAEQFLTQTDANGVVTGQPEVVTSQPAVVTSQPVGPPADVSIPAVVTTQPLPASLPIFGPGIHTHPLGNTTTLIISVATDGSSTSIVEPTPTPTGGEDSEGDSPAESDATTTGSAAEASDTGAASPLKMASGAFIGAGALIAAFL